MGKRLSVRAVIALSLGAAALGIAPAASAVSGFTGDYAPSHWTTVLTGTPGGGGAPVGATNDGSSLTLASGDSGCATGPCQLFYGIAIPGPDSLFSFHWSYASSDLDGPAFESFGYVVDGSFTQLTDPGGLSLQSGDQVLSLAVGSQFSWYVDCADCIFGNAVTTITNVQAVPEPSSLALLGLGVAAVVARRRRRRA